MPCQIGEVSMAENLTAGCHRMSPMVRLCISKNQHDNLPIWEEVIYFEEATKGFLVSYSIYANHSIFSKTFSSALVYQDSFYLINYQRIYIS